MDLHGRIALVTGGAHRLGWAIALALGQAGANVVVHYHRSAEQTTAVLDELRALGVQAAAIPGDLSIVTEAERVIDVTVDQWGRLDLLVNNAGIWGATPIGTVTPATALPDALMVPPNETSCPPDTTVRPVARLLFALITLMESLMNALAPVPI